MRPNKRKWDSWTDNNEVVVGDEGIKIKTPEHFLWPFPLWPINVKRPFNKELQRTGDLPDC